MPGSSQAAYVHRPEGATLPESGADDQWGELLIRTATPEVGKQWTGTGRSRSDAI